MSASEIESLSRSALEAVAFDTRVITTAVFGLPEVIMDGRDGILVEPWDLLALESGLRRFLALDRPTRTMMGRQARRRVRSWFRSRDDLVAWSAIPDGLANDPRRPPMLATP